MKPETIKFNSNRMTFLALYACSRLYGLHIHTAVALEMLHGEKEQAVREQYVMKKNEIYTKFCRKNTRKNAAACWISQQPAPPP